ncbi:MAG: translation initiation factor IF-3 [Verrucomicrobia bacterium]|nr:translation initiation factor IF-3 [Verrucomicrobiota bacterium]
MPIQNFVRVNHKIRAREVRVIDSDGKQAGIMLTSQALGLAQQRGMDLVEIAPNANPPVCKVVEYGKFKYEQEKREREARKHQHADKLKEIKLRLNIDNHDYETKVKHVRDFLEDGIKVKVSLFFRGREMGHAEFGDKLMQRVLNDLTGVCHVESPPRLMGRTIHMMLGPVRGAGQKQKQQPRQEQRAEAM